MDIRKLLGMVLLGASVALAGCGDSGNGGTDSGPSDSGGDDAGNGGGLDLPTAMVGGEVNESDSQDQMGGSPANFGCMGSRMTPTEDGDAVDFEFTLEDFQSSNPVPEVCVNFYADNTVPMTDTCGGTMTNDSGVITVNDVPGSWYAYQVFPKEGATAADTVVGSIQVNEEADAGGVIGNSVSAQTINLIPTVLGFSRASGTALIAGQAYDCDDEAVFGTVVRIYVGGSLVAEGEASEDPHYRYFDGGDFPSSDQPYTHVDGLYAAANIPVDSAGQEFTLELWATLDGESEAQVVGCATSRLLPDGVSILNIGPMRGDGPSCPGAM